MLTDKQKHQIFEEAVKTAYESIVESQCYDFLWDVLRGYTKTKSLEDQLQMISSDHECQREILCFDPDTGEKYDEDKEGYCPECNVPGHDVCSMTPGCPCCDDTILGL